MTDLAFSPTGVSCTVYTYAESFLVPSCTIAKYLSSSAGVSASFLIISV